MTKHTLGSMFAAIFRPFVEAYRDETQGRKPQPRTNDVTTGPKLHGIPASDPERIAVAVPERADVVAAWTENVGEWHNPDGSIARALSAEERNALVNPEADTGETERDDVQPIGPVLAVADGQTWREAIAERLAKDPTRVRKPKAKPTRKPRTAKPKTAKPAKAKDKARKVK